MVSPLYKRLRKRLYKYNITNFLFMQVKKEKIKGSLCFSCLLRHTAPCVYPNVRFIPLHVNKKAALCSLVKVQHAALFA